MACLGNRSATTEMASWRVFQAGDTDEKRQLAVGMLAVLLAEAGHQEAQ